MATPITVGAIGATGQTVANGLLASSTNFKLGIIAAIKRAHPPYTVINLGCWYQVFVPKVPSGRSDHAHSKFLDHRIVDDENQSLALTDMAYIGIYVANIIADPRTLTRHVFAYTEVLSMNEIWDAMATTSEETPPKTTCVDPLIKEIIETWGKKLRASPHSAHHSNNIMDTTNFNMGQYHISWCVWGDDTPEYADNLGYLDFWKLYPSFPKGRSLGTFYQQILVEAVQG
ncbi:hypothetical protein BOTCAL_0590g00010 [Botryotinia calthae]|uniref:Uncharacterized protein n=1 Tax=Botryotinia calthae TaxID=38488 RepID=A0A4Y8CLD3_9HELO|nr:hypothetical protein BOTCAL_0590g00010 [Botryotinia calthae]